MPSALQNAARTSYARKLVDEATQATIEEWQKQNGKLALHKAVEDDKWKRDATKVGLLIDAERDALTRTDVGFRLPVHLAARGHASVEVVALLLEFYPDGAEEKTWHGYLPVHLAARGQASEEVVALLLECFPEGAKAMCKDGNLPIHLAAMYEASAEVVALLYEACPDAMAKLDAGQAEYVEKKRKQGAAGAQAARESVRALLDKLEARETRDRRIEPETLPQTEEETSETVAEAA
jgi:ankyrin repeat protein